MYYYLESRISCCTVINALLKPYHTGPSRAVIFVFRLSPSTWCFPRKVGHALSSPQPQYPQISDKNTATANKSIQSLKAHPSIFLQELQNRKNTSYLYLSPFSLIPCIIQKTAAEFEQGQSQSDKKEIFLRSRFCFFQSEQNLRVPSAATLISLQSLKITIFCKTANLLLI